MNMILQMQQQVRESGVIDGFYYPYARLLLDKFIEIRSSKDYEEIDNGSSLYNLTICLRQALNRQISDGHACFSDDDFSDDDTLIQTARAFLAIFEEEKEK